MGTPSPTRFSGGRALAEFFSGGAAVAAGGLRVRMGAGARNRLRLRGAALCSMPDRNHGNIEILRALRCYAHGRRAI
jgi:hypothetical protein